MLGNRNAIGGLEVRISLNIILDIIAKYNFELHVDQSTQLAFRCLAQLPRDLMFSEPECLYVGWLSAAMRMKKQLTGFYCLCIRDRIRDIHENDEDALSGLIIINENLELETLSSEIQYAFAQINQWYQDMQEAVIMQKSMQDIISLSEGVIGNFISVSDSSLSLQAYTKNITTDDPTSLFLIKNGYHSEEDINKFKKLKRYDTWMNSDGPIISTDRKISKYVIVSKVFSFNETYFTHVVMSCNHREITPGLLDLFNHMTYILTYYIKRNWEEKKNFDHVYSSLVVDLIQGKIKDQEAVNERARIAGIRPEGQYMVFILTGGNSGDAVFPGLLSHDITQMIPQMRPVFFNCRLMLFLHHVDLARFIEEQGIEEKLNDYLQKNSVFCGASDILDDLLELSEAFTQADLALNESTLNRQRMNVIWEDASRWGNIARFSTLFPSCLLNKSDEIIRLWKGSQYGKLLLELYRIDLEKGTNNLEVLYVFLMNERRAAETADILHMHRNNVVYRITRIEEMLGINLDDKQTRINLFVSFLMFKCTGTREQQKNKT